MKRLLSLSLTLVTTALLVAGSCYAKDDKSKGVKIGDPAPDWQSLPGVDGKDHALSDFKGAKAMVLIFTCNHCPVAVAYEDRILALQRDYQAKGVQIVAVCVNKGPADSLAKLKERAASKGFNFPYLSDESQASGRDYGAIKTPHIFVLDKHRKVAYIGALDDNMDEQAVTKHYVRDALDALLAGKQPPTKETKAVGCGIGYN
jgi:peroxiredoxin